MLATTALLVAGIIAGFVCGTDGCPIGGPPCSPAPSPTPSGPGGGRDAFGTIQAESFATQSGVTVQSTSDNYAVYRGVTFGTATAHQFKARVASGAPGGVSGLVEVRIGSATAAPIGSFAIGSTGGWQSWQTIPANISGVTGTRDVYVTFTSGQPADFVNLNWFSFAT